MILMKNMLLKKLISNLPKEKKKIKVLGLSTNSKKVKKGFIFFAVRGNKINGERYITQAIKKGAVAIVCSKNCNYVNNKIVVKKTSNVRSFLSQICSKYYRLKPKNIIAVTGTNGKTSVADLFYQILNINKIPVASIGTLGIKYKKRIIKSELTSPDTISLHKELEKIKKNKIDNVIIEASSHGLHQKRLEHLKIKAGIFTNFSQDHLDYHKNMKSYLDAKLRLFKKILPVKSTVISDKFIKEFSILKKISKKKQMILIDINEIKKNLINIKNLKFNEFQLKNLSMAIVAAKLCGFKNDKIEKTLKNIKLVEGRLELVKTFTNNVEVYVDFAHTPDALQKTLNALKNSRGQNISLVFGCGGERDFKKRPIMAKIAKLNCKKIYVTDDNPRNENPKKIRNEITRNLINANYFDISNRALAIKTAIKNAEPNEVILVAGKGHESEQIYKNQIIKISDKKIIKKIKVRIKKISKRKQNFLQNEIIFNEIQKGYNVKNFHGLAIDTRLLKKGNLFLTINGKKRNGIEFISKAIKKGAKYIISRKKIKKFKNKSIRVTDEIKFLNAFAFKKRDKTKAKIIAITGSAGKTSLKNLIKDLLQNFSNTFCSPKSYNNHLGVPLSLSQLNTSHEFGVFEVGMSKPGEINKLSKMIRPHIGIITNIGEAHIENFENLKGIADAKGELINNISKNGTIILNRDDKFFNYLKRKAIIKNLKIISFGKDKKSDVCLYNLVKNKFGYKLIIKIKEKFLKFEVKNLNIYNVLSSITLLEVLNLNFDKILKYYKTYQPSDGRGKIHSINRYNRNFKLIDESYNANPLSVKSAIQNFDSIKKNNFKKYLILGDMLELGKRSEILHKDMSKVINNSDIDKVFIKGEKTLETYKKIKKQKRGNIFQIEEDIDFTLNNIIANNDYLMIKGSNATGLNILSKKIIKGQ